MQKYSFVLPAYKPEYLKDAIESILGQSMPDFSLIIVDDGSPYDIAPIIEGFSDERIKFFRNDENLGRANLVKAWDECVRRSDSEYFILASDDDLYDSDFLEKMDRLVAAYPDVDVFQSLLRRIDSQGNILGQSKKVPEYMPVYEYAYNYMQGNIESFLQNHIFKRRAFDAMGGLVDFPLAWCSDDASVMALGFNGIVTSDEILFSARTSDKNISSANSDIDTVRKKIKAENMFSRWIDTVLVPKIRSLRSLRPGDDAMIEKVCGNLSGFVRTCSLNRIFSTPVSMSLKCRDLYIENNGRRVFYSVVRKKLWSDYKFLFSLKYWLHR